MTRCGPKTAYGHGSFHQQMKSKKPFITVSQSTQQLADATEGLRETKRCIRLFFLRSDGRTQSADIIFTGAVQTNSPPLRRIRLHLGEAGEFIVHRPGFSLDSTTISAKRIVSISALRSGPRQVFVLSLSIEVKTNMYT